MSLLLALTSLVSLNAQAAEPVVQPDGSVCMTVILPASESAVRAELDTAAEASALHGDATLVSQERQGACERSTFKTRGLISSISYVALRCPTADGWKQTLVSSETFEQNEAEWSLRPVEGGTELRYRIRVSLDLPVGQGMVNAQISESMSRAVERLEARLGLK
jgi:hypothetical protein